MSVVETTPQHCWNDTTQLDDALSYGSIALYLDGLNGAIRWAAYVSQLLGKAILKETYNRGHKTPRNAIALSTLTVERYQPDSPSPVTFKKASEFGEVIRCRWNPTVGILPYVSLNSSLFPHSLPPPPVIVTFSTFHVTRKRVRTSYFLLAFFLQREVNCLNSSRTGGVERVTMTSFRHPESTRERQ